MTFLNEIDTLPPKLGISATLTTGYYYLHSTHRLWRWKLQTKEIFENRDNFKKFAAGSALDWLVGHTLLVRTASQAILIVRRTFDLLQQKQLFAEAYKEWIATLTGRTIFRIPIKAYSSATLQTLKRPIIYLYLLAMRVMRCTWSLIKEGFILSMCMLDLTESLSLDPTKNSDTVNMVFLNASKLCDSMAVEKEYILDEMYRHEEMIEQLLTEVHSPYHVKDLIQSVSTTLNRVQRVSRLVGSFPQRIVNQAFRWTRSDQEVEEKTLKLQRWYYDNDTRICPARRC